MKKIVAVILVILIVSGVYLFSNLGETVKKIIETAGTQTIGTKVSVSGVNVSPANKMASMSGLAVANPAGFKTSNLLKTKSISVTLDTVSSKTVFIKEITVDGMSVSYELGPNGTNLDAIQKRLKSAPAEQPATGKAAGKSGGGYDVVIDRLVITNAQVIPAVGGINKPVNLPDIVLKNIGSKGNPATPAQVAAAIMNRIVATSSAAALRSGLSSALQNSGGGAAVDQAKGALKGLFGK